MADPEKEGGDLAEAEANILVAEQQVVEDTTEQTEEIPDFVETTEKYIDATQPNETAVPAEQEQLMLESRAAEEEAERLDTVTEQKEAHAELPVQEDVADVKYFSDEIQSDVDTPAPVVAITAKTVKILAENLSGLAAETPVVDSTLSGALGSQTPQVPEDTKDSTTTVKIMLHPDIQVFTKAFDINRTVGQMKQYFSSRLKIPQDVLQFMLLGRIMENSETLQDLGATCHETIQFDMFSLDEEHFPIQSSRLLNEYYMPDVITIRVQTDEDTFQDVSIAITRPTFQKPFLGGFRHRLTGMEYHNAGSQTVPKKRPEKGYEEFCRSTQTVVERKKLQQTRNTTSTQMTKIGVYVSNITDRLIEPKGYVTAEEYHARRLKAVIVIQTYFRRWNSINIVARLKEEKRLREEWEEQEEQRKEREKAGKLRREYERRMHPKTKDDFELLYHALELWRQEELARIDSTFTGAERKAALCELLEKEAQLIASIGRHKLNADDENEQMAILSFLEKCAKPKRWKAFDGKITEMDTQFTLRARELLDIYRSISMKDILQDERLDVLLTLKHTVKVPPDPMKLYHNIYFCLGCKCYLPSTDFALAASSRTVGRCRRCCKLDNEARQREAFLKYKLMLRNLRQSEMNYKDNAKIAFLIQQQDLQYMVEKFWGSQSALSAWDDLYDMVMVRWDKYHEWAPWNTILLTKDEAEAHLKLTNLEKAYEMVFIHRIKHKHILAKNYFSQFPEMAAVLHRGDTQACSSDLLVTKPLTPSSAKQSVREKTVHRFTA
uniref:IQ and ubiquitin-like domain-containing protein n=1 Tax=Euleptes europaea TaxID=460621 RepID=UPI00253F9E03|nr:IQ and ubiquitin-like domain-containing protein [Euleptes europaea]